MDQQAFVATARAQLRSWNADLVELRARLELGDGPIPTAAQDHIDTFLAHRQLAEATLERIAKAAPTAWADRGPVFVKAWKALEQRFDMSRASVS